MFYEFEEENLLGTWSMNTEVFLLGNDKYYHYH